jgi:hypothetical protein
MIAELLALTTIGFGAEGAIALAAVGLLFGSFLSLPLPGSSVLNRKFPNPFVVVILFIALRRVLRFLLRLSKVTPVTEV